MDPNKSNLTALSVQACETIMRKFDARELPPVKHFHYHQGVFLSGMHHVWKLTGDRRYLNYIREYVDTYVHPDGNITGFNPGQMDDLQPGVLLYSLLDETGEEKYRLALDTIAYYYNHMPTTPEGGFWHKAWYRNQMWLDGLYMAGPFMTEYGCRFGRPEMIDQVVFQAKMMREKTQVKETGLWRHAWDYEKRQPWADPVSGKSPECWGRAMGWVPVALLTDCDLLPKEDTRRKELAGIAVELLKSLLPYQDSKTGLWYQVVDKGNQPGNWLESSCTCLYAAGICMAVRQGFLDKDYLEQAKAAARGIINRLETQGNDLMVGNICVGTSVGNYEYYSTRPTGVNDLHGMGAFLLMATEMAAVLPCDQ